MPDTNNSLSTTQSGGVSMQMGQTGQTTATKNDAQFPYSSSESVTEDPDVASAAVAAAPSSRPMLPASIAALVGPVFVDEAYDTLSIVTRTARVQKERSTQDLKNSKNRLEAQSARQKEAHDKYVRDFIRMMRHAKAMAGLRLFIKIAAPIAAAAATVATLGTGSVVAAGLCAYALAATTTDAAGGPSLGMAENSQKGLALAFKEMGMSDKEAEEYGGLAAGLIAIAATGKYSNTALLMADPSFAGMFTGNLARILGMNEEDAGYVEMATTLATGLFATGHQIYKTGGAGGGKAGQAEAEAGVDGGAAGARGAAAAGQAADDAAGGAAVAGQAVDDAGVAGARAADAAQESVFERVLPYVIRYGNYSSGGMTVATSASAGAQGGLELESQQAQTDMTIDENEVRGAQLGVEESNDAIQKQTREFRQLADSFLKEQQRALDIIQHKHQTSMRIIAA